MGNAVEKFAEIFQGRLNACGRLSDDGKKGWCDKTHLSLEQYKRHLTGESYRDSLGLYPLMDNGTVKLSVIDSDNHNGEDHAQLAINAASTKDKLASWGIVCYIEISKSGGIHIWVFFCEPVRAALARRLLRVAWQEAVGGTVPEIFPKQDQLTSGQDYGNFINLPYYLQSAIKNRRVMTDGDRFLTLEEFLGTVRRHTRAELEAAIAALPRELETIIKVAAPVGECIPEGERNITLASLAGTMRRRGISQEAIEAALWAENEARCAPPLERQEVARIAASIGRYAPADSSHFPSVQDFSLTDMGNAGRLVSRHGKVIRYCYNLGKWLIWDGQRWKIDENGGIDRLAKDTVLAMYSEATETVDNDARKSLIKHAIRSEGEARLKAMISLAKSEEDVPVQVDQLDAGPWLLTCLNGTVDLRTGELFPSRQEDLITKQIPVIFDKAAICPAWEKFLFEIFQGNKKLIAFVKKVIGYCLTGSTIEQIILILYGIGANGKSVLIALILALLGDYGLQTPTETLLVTKNDGIRNDLARLKGARFVAAVESDEGRRLSESTIKQLTGGDAVSARFLHHEYFDFFPECKIILATNHRPQIKGTDQGIWRRIRLIPFNYRVPDQKQDKGLLDKLKAELPGILNWAIEGCLAWQKEGLGMPDEVKSATEGYRAESDILANFISDRCHIHPSINVQAGALYMAYVQWARESGEEAKSQRLFGMGLSERGFQRERGTGNKHMWRGIDLADIPGDSWLSADLDLV